MDKKPSQVVSGLVDGVEVLRCLAASPEPVTGVSIARKLDLSPVRVSRLLTTLSWMGIVHRDKSRRYSPGAGMHALATQNLAASGLLKRVIEHTQPLQAYPHTVAAGVLWRDQVTFLYFRDAYRGTVESAIEGVRQWITPATRSSIGMVLLAHRSDEEILALYGDRDDIPGLYPTTDKLMRAINEIRASDHAAVRWPTHTSLAVTIGHPPYTALAISGFNTPEDERHFLTLLKQAARRIEAAGGDEQSPADDSDAELDGVAALTGGVYV